MAAAAYASAARVLLHRDHLSRTFNATAADPAAFHALWRHTPLSDSCPLFARKITPDSADVLDGLLEDCAAVGLGAGCLEVAERAERGFSR